MHIVFKIRQNEDFFLLTRCFVLVKINEFPDDFHVCFHPQVQSIHIFLQLVHAPVKKAMTLIFNIQEELTLQSISVQELFSSKWDVAYKKNSNFDGK